MTAGANEWTIKRNTTVFRRTFFGIGLVEELHENVEMENTKRMKDDNISDSIKKFTFQKLKRHLKRQLYPLTSKLRVRFLWKLH